MRELYFYLGGYVTGLLAAWLLTKVCNVFEYKRKSVFENDVTKDCHDKND